MSGFWPPCPSSSDCHSGVHNRVFWRYCSSTLQKVENPRLSDCAWHSSMAPRFPCPWHLAPSAPCWASCHSFGQQPLPFQAVPGSPVMLASNVTPSQLQKPLQIHKNPLQKLTLPPHRRLLWVKIQVQT